MTIYDLGFWISGTPLSGYLLLFFIVQSIYISYLMRMIIKEMYAQGMRGSIGMGREIGNSKIIFGSIITTTIVDFIYFIQGDLYILPVLVQIVVMGGKIITYNRAKLLQIRLQDCIQ